MPVIVIIGPAEALPSLRKQFPPDSAVQTFAYQDVGAAVEFIATHRPDAVALEGSFAVSPRGEALVARIMDDPSLATCQIRILTQAGVAREPARKAAASDGAVPKGASLNGGSPQTLDHSGTRRVERIRMVAGASVIIDGNTAQLVDLSTLGAQVVSRIVLRPNQRVRLLFPEEHSEGRRPLRCSGSVVWASYEMPPGEAPRYRAGLKISGVDVDAVHRYAERHRDPGAAAVEELDEAN